MTALRVPLAATAGQREMRLRDLARLGRSVIADAVPSYMAIIGYLVEFGDDLGREDAKRLIDKFRTECLVFALPLLRTARMLAEAGHELVGEDADDDPRILLPLVRTLGESYASLASVSEIRELGLAFPAPPEAITSILDDPRLNRWMIAQRRHGRLEPT